MLKSPEAQKDKMKGSNTAYMFCSRIYHLRKLQLFARTVFITHESQGDVSPAAEITWQHHLCTQRRL